MGRQTKFALLHVRSGNVVRAASVNVMVPIYTEFKTRLCGIYKLNPLTGTFTPQNNGPLYSNTVIGILAVDGWAVTFGPARRGLGGLRPRPVPSSLYEM